MKTLHLVDPSSRDMVANFPVFDPAAMGVEAFRAAVASLYANTDIPDHEKITAPGMAGAPGVRLAMYRPAHTTTPLPVILYIHGGGFVAGSADVMGPACADLARDTGALIVAISYRLAPETPFPGPVEDCYAALVWISENSGMLGIDPDRVAVLGQSAGGGLAAALAQLARDRGGPRLGAQFLVYPMLDPRTGTGAAPVDNCSTGEFLWTRAANQFGWLAMLGDGDIAPDRIGHFAPALASSFDSLPATFIAVGSIDLFVEENAAYALALSRAGVPVELHVYPGAVHGFDALPGELATAFRADLLKAIHRWSRQK